MSICLPVTPIPRSVFQLTNLIEGEFDIGVTAIDNVIAHNGRSECQLPDISI